MELVFKRRRTVAASDKNAVLLMLLAYNIYFLAYLPCIIYSNSSKLIGFFVLFIAYSLNVCIKGKTISVRDKCIFNVIIFNYIR